MHLRTKRQHVIRTFCKKSSKSALAGIPAVDGTSAIDSIKEVTQPGLSVWQFLCIGAALTTRAATISTSIRSNQNTANRVAKAQVCDAKLEMLELICRTIELIQSKPLKSIVSTQPKFYSLIDSYSDLRMRKVYG